MSEIAVLIPTLRRPDSLARALRSVFAQDRARALMAEIVVIDNSPEASARATVDQLRLEAPVPLVFVHAPKPGVATARNAGLVATTAPYLAFLDDDEEASPRWLAALFDTHRRFEADVTFGAVRGVIPQASPAWSKPYLERFFSRLGPSESGLTDQVFGCGNSLMTRATALARPEPFATAADQTGGEDDRLFTDLTASGARFAWASEAWVFEHAPVERARVGYALSRAVGYGQTPSQMAARDHNWPALAKWIVIGAGQAAVFGLAALGLWTLRRRTWLEFADRAARGLGKTLWFAHLNFYGQAAAKRRSIPPQTSVTSLKVEA